MATPELEVDYVVINAGVLKYPNRATEMSFDDFAFHMNTNTVGPIICAQRLLKSSVPIRGIVFMSSDSGSVQCFREMEDGFAAYAASKAALNHALRHMDAELKRKGEKTMILALHPGEVITDMTKIEISWEVEGEMTPEESVSHCIKVIESKGIEDSGTFWTWENKVGFLIGGLERTLTLASLGRGELSVCTRNLRLLPFLIHLCKKIHMLC